MYIDESKAKKHQVQYRTSIVVAVRRRWWCPLLSVVSGGCPSPCVTIGPQWWSSIAVVVSSPRWWLSITVRSHWWSSSLCIIIRHNPLLSPSPSIAIAVAICHQSLLSIVSRCCCWLLLVFVVGCQSLSLWLFSTHCWLSSLVVSCQSSSSLWLSVMVVNAIVVLPVVGAA